MSHSDLHSRRRDRPPVSASPQRNTINDIAYELIASHGAAGVRKTQVAQYLIRNYPTILLKENGDLRSPLRDLDDSKMFEEFVWIGEESTVMIRLARFSDENNPYPQQEVSPRTSDLVIVIQNFLNPFGDEGTFSSQVADHLLVYYRDLLSRENICLTSSWSTRILKQYDQYFVLFRRDQDNAQFVRNRTVNDIAFEFIATHGAAGIRKSLVSDYLIRNHSRLLMNENGDLGTPLRNLSGEMFEEFVLSGELSTRLIRLTGFSNQNRNTSVQVPRQEVTRRPSLVDVIRNFLTPFGDDGTFSSQVADHLLRNHRDLLIKENVDFAPSWSTRLLKQYDKHFELYRPYRSSLFVRNVYLNSNPNSILRWQPLQVHPNKRVRYTILTDILECREAFTFLNKYALKESISIDCEGTQLSNGGELYLLTISTENSTCEGFQSDVYIVDLDNFHLHGITYTYMEHKPRIPIELLADSGLRQLLENPNIVKLVHDCRNGAAAMFFQARIRLRGVFDTQLAICEVEGHDIRMRLAEVIEKYTDFEHKSKSTIKDQMREDSRYWLRRPLLADNIRYMIEDVVYLCDVFVVLRRRFVTRELYLSVLTLSNVEVTKQTKETEEAKQQVCYCCGWQKFSSSTPACGCSSGTPINSPLPRSADMPLNYGSGGDPYSSSDDDYIYHRDYTPRRVEDLHESSGKEQQRMLLDIASTTSILAGVAILAYKFFFPK